MNDRDRDDLFSEARTALKALAPCRPPSPEALERVRLRLEETLALTGELGSGARPQTSPVRTPQLDGSSLRRESASIGAPPPLVVGFIAALLVLSKPPAAEPPPMVESSLASPRPSVPAAAWTESAQESLEAPPVSSSANTTARASVTPMRTAPRRITPTRLPLVVRPGANRQTPPPSADLAEENRLLARAMQALQQKAPDASLAVLSEHARRFPDGQHRELRDALLIQALARTGEKEEARRAAVQFQERFPASVFLSVVRRAIEP